MLIKAPRTPRQLFDAYRFLGAAGGLNKITEAMDFEGVGAGQVHYAAYGKLLDALGLLARQDGYDAALHLRQCLGSDAFQKTLLDRMLCAYPEKRRLLLVHVPKCAGSDLTVHLMGRHPSISQRVAERSWMPPAKLHAAIKKFSDESAFSDSIFVHGHIPLQHYLRARQVRAGDEVFSVLRDPAEMVVSKINYVMTRFVRDPAITKVDTTDWAGFLERETIDRALASGDMLPLAREILHSRGLIPNNMICTYLGRGDAASALSMCMQSDIELTDVSRYQEWLGARWGVTSETRHNASVRHIAVADLDERDLRRVQDATAEDRRIFTALSRALDAAGTPSVRGAALRPFLC